MYSAKATALLILDAQNRTKVVPEKLESELTYVAGWCYWYKGTSLVKEFAYSCLELLTKEKLNLILKELGLTVAKSSAKEDIVKVLKEVKITELRAVLTKKVMPEFELSVVTFEKLFRISTANRRRLQEIDDALPILYWGESKYGRYPVLSLLKILEILHADKTLLKQFYDYVEEKLTAKAKQIARDKELELSFKDKYLNRVAEHPELENNDNIKKFVKQERFRAAYSFSQSLIQQKEKLARDKAIEFSFQHEYLDKAAKYPELTQDNNIQQLVEKGFYKSALKWLNELIQKQEKLERQIALELSFRDKFLLKSSQYPSIENKQLQKLFKEEQYQAAYNKLNELIQEQEKFNRLHQQYIELCKELGTTPEQHESLKTLTKAIQELQTIRKDLANKGKMQEFAKSLDALLQEEVEIFSQTSNHQFQYSKELQSNNKALKFCQLVLSSKGICVENQLRWKNIGNITETIANYEDLIFSHPVLLQIQGVAELA
ncbi:hypothetical protein NIES4071_03530 [Calothrix sp. NIES-4071]|nr:hypothetical protein NIES4071_03530 [Calothrix sp. NIES-4071]BAZ54699.1 hypothetical protein NIES4105_03520 [Calothrix sp. NIES-4105]